MLNALKRTPLYRTAKHALYAYRAPKAPASNLSPNSIESVSMKMDADSSSRPTEDLYRIWQTIPGGHKWWHFFPVYERIVGPLRTKPIRMLEVGVYKGGSLAMWKKYLHPESVVVGLDIDQACAAFDRPAEGVHVRVGDQSDVSFLAGVASELGPFDVIIDDGSHVSSHMVKTFDYLFLNCLKNRGVYIAEDTHTNFWHGYRDQRYSFIDLCKDLVDLSHAHYFDHHGIESFTLGSPRRLNEIAVSRIGAQVEEIRFLDSIIVIQRRADRPLPTIEHL
jgi:hypothetical protein